jgi:hypothetical protein
MVTPRYSQQRHLGQNKKDKVELIIFSYIIAKILKFHSPASVKMLSAILEIFSFSADTDQTLLR